MEFLGWVLFVLLLIWFIAGMRFSHKKRLHLNYYIVYLLLNDATREKHKQDFEKLIRETDANDASSLSLKAYNALEGMADRLAAGDPNIPSTSSVLGAHAMIWECKKAK
jgi:hypothetical protein